VKEMPSDVIISQKGAKMTAEAIKPCNASITLNLRLSLP
jgi:hypothetical protein